MREAFLGPWPWYVTGPLIGLMVPLLLLLTGKSMGISGSFDSLCALPLRKSRLKDRLAGGRSEGWKVALVAGIALGGFLAARVAAAQAPDLFPADYRGAAGAAALLAGGFLVGFGSRYAKGCTSGHAITGLASLQKSALVAVIGFFTGGLAMAGLALLLGKA